MKTATDGGSKVFSSSERKVCRFFRESHRVEASGQQSVAGVGTCWPTFWVRQPLPKLLLPLNPSLLHSQTDGTCTELRGRCKPHRALQSQHESCCWAVCRCRGFSIRRWRETTSQSASVPPQRCHLRQPCCWLANRGGKWVKEPVNKSTTHWTLLHNWDVPPHHITFLL